MKLYLHRFFFGVRASDLFHLLRPKSYLAPHVKCQQTSYCAYCISFVIVIPMQVVLRALTMHVQQRHICWWKLYHTHTHTYIPDGCSTIFSLVILSLSLLNPSLYLSLSLSLSLLFFLSLSFMLANFMKLSYSEQKIRLRFKIRTPIQINLSLFLSCHIIRLRGSTICQQKHFSTAFELCVRVCVFYRVLSSLLTNTAPFEWEHVVSTFIQQVLGKFVYWAPPSVQCQAWAVRILCCESICVCVCVCVCV